MQSLKTTQMMTITILTKKKVVGKVLPRGALQDGKTHPWTFSSVLINLSLGLLFDLLSITYIIMVIILLLLQSFGHLEGDDTCLITARLIFEQIFLIFLT